VDLALVVGLVEQQMMQPGDEATTGGPNFMEALTPRIGETMVQRGHLTPEGLQQALAYQKQRSDEGQSILLGQAMLALGLTDRETLDQVIAMQIMELHYALREANQALKRRVAERTKELQRALERLSELSILKSNFISNISHELRTPLTHIKGYLDLLSDGGLGPMTNSQTEAVAVMLKAEARLERMIEDLIQFSVTTRGELSLRLKSFDIRLTTRQVVERSYPKAQMQAITLHTAIPADLPLVRGDEEKVAWVISQLVDNALKFTPKGGRVSIRLRGDDGVVNVAVVDTGIGIPDDRLQEIFEPFHQLDGSPTRRYAGAGIGLTLVRRIVEAHGSQMIVESALGKGSQFEFNLPSISKVYSKEWQTQEAE
jgi:signal transduction histidine kinase